MATRNSGRSDDRSSSRSASSAGASSGRREGAAGAPSSGGSRQNSGVNAGIAGTGRTGGIASNAGAGPESRTSASHTGGTGTAQNSGAQSSTTGADQERQLRTSREEGSTRASSRGNVGQTQQQQPTPQQGRPYPTSGYYGGGSPFAMMRRMMDDMDRLFSDFGLAQPGWMSSSFFGPDIWPSADSSRAVGASQSGSASQQRSLSGQTGGQHGTQRTGEAGGLQGWQQGLWSPQVEVRERGNNIVVRADLPGLSRDDVDVEIDEDNLIIRGERHNDWEDQNKEQGYYRSERSYGSFYRAIPLPEGVDPNACNATFENGVLEVTLPKPKESQSRGKKIQVK